MDGWRAWKAPLIDAFGPMSFTEVASISADPVEPLPSKHTGAWLHDLRDETIDVLVRYGIARRPEHPLMFAEVRHAGGAIARMDGKATAYTHRTAPFNLFLLGVTPTPEAQAAFQRHTDAMKALLKPSMTGGVYMNFLEGEEARQRTKDAYSPETFQRLAALKALLDPTNRLGYSFQIEPDRPA